MYSFGESFCCYEFCLNVQSCSRAGGLQTQGQAASPEKGERFQVGHPKLQLGNIRQSLVPILFPRALLFRNSPFYQSSHFRSFMIQEDEGQEAGLLSESEPSLQSAKVDTTYQSLHTVVDIFRY